MRQFFNIFIFILLSISLESIFVNSMMFSQEKIENCHIQNNNTDQNHNPSISVKEKYGPKTELKCHVNCCPVLVVELNKNNHRIFEKKNENIFNNYLNPKISNLKNRLFRPPIDLLYS